MHSERRAVRLGFATSLEVLTDLDSDVDRSLTQEVYELIISLEVVDVLFATFACIGVTKRKNHCETIQIYTDELRLPSLNRIDFHVI